MGASTVGGLVVAGSSTAGADPGPASGGASTLDADQILLGASLHHTFTPQGGVPVSEALAKPDDITQLDGRIFVGFQNGVGPQGQPSADGNTASTIVELTPGGHVLGQWDITGKADGVTADPALDSVIATVNEDNNSSLYLIDPDHGPGAVTHYRYNEPLPHGGGTDAISIIEGHILISASAPGTTGQPAPQPTYPAVYSVTLDPATRVASVSTLFDDEDPATVASVGSPQFGHPVDLALTDPDSSEVVPWESPRFGGQFLLTSQGDLEQIYVSDPGGPHQRLSVLTLTQSVDDTAFVTDPDGVLYATDSTNDAVVAVTGRFRPGQELVAATPCGANSAPATCPAPLAYPANYLGSLNPWTGQVQALAVTGRTFTPQGGLLYLTDHDGDHQ